MVSNLHLSILGESAISAKKKLLLLCTQLISLAIIIFGLNPTYEALYWGEGLNKLTYSCEKEYDYLNQMPEIFA